MNISLIIVQDDQVVNPSAFSLAGMQRKDADYAKDSQFYSQSP